MKVGTIVRIGTKGQIVIPKEIRDDLGLAVDSPLNILLENGGIYIQPVESILTHADRETTYTEILKKTQGAWASDRKDKNEKKKKIIELNASQNRKNLW